eukprot:TRINITY_DN8738_c0_g1_i1.p1 TRINITY_DN8738_c0_g1~~TRINITY_DN8738_c0_g1_i1.p1  ORF type:complete len:106 (-),score=24.24 TRINITY_DN8738_c0_g1_i1:73-390(-)
MSCSAFGACAGATLNFNVALERIGKVECSEQYACYGATLNFEGNGQVVTVDTVDCGGASGCDNMKIILSNADVGLLKCPLPSNCQGCLVYRGGLHDPHPKDCYGW